MLLYTFLDFPVYLVDLTSLHTSCAFDSAVCIALSVIRVFPEYRMKWKTIYGYFTSTLNYDTSNVRIIPRDTKFGRLVKCSYK